MTSKEFSRLLICERFKKECDRILVQADRAMWENHEEILTLYNEIIDNYVFPTYTPNLFPAAF